MAKAPVIHKGLWPPELRWVGAYDSRVVHKRVDGHLTSHIVCVPKSRCKCLSSLPCQRSSTIWGDVTCKRCLARKGK